MAIKPKIWALIAVGIHDDDGTKSLCAGGVLNPDGSVKWMPFVTTSPRLVTIFKDHAAKISEESGHEIALVEYGAANILERYKGGKRVPKTH